MLIIHNKTESLPATNWSWIFKSDLIQKIYPDVQPRQHSSHYRPKNKTKISEPRFDSTNQHTNSRILL